MGKRDMELQRHRDTNSKSEGTKERGREVSRDQIIGRPDHFTVKK